MDQKTVVIVLIVAVAGIAIGASAVYLANNDYFSPDVEWSLLDYGYGYRIVFDGPSDIVGKIATITTAKGDHLYADIFLERGKMYAAVYSKPVSVSIPGYHCIDTHSVTRV